MDLKSLIRQNKTFLLLHAVLLLVGSYPLVMFDKVTLFLKLNSLHHPFFDQFFYYITFLGSSAAYGLLMATLVAMKRHNRSLLLGASSFVAMSGIVQGLKRIVCLNQLRPIALIPTAAPLHLVEGMVPPTHLSFPSGHAATIFTAVCLVHLLAPKKPCWFSVLLFLLACAVAYSRIYLCQHFYRDVYIGALIGMWSTTAVYAVLKHWQGPAWLDQTLRYLLPIKLKRKA